MTGSLFILAETSNLKSGFNSFRKNTKGTLQGALSETKFNLPKHGFIKELPAML
jgi:hypothetical protein